MFTSLDDLIAFLDTVAGQGFINPNTANARKTACVKFFGILEPDQRTAEYVRDNLDVVKQRFATLNTDVMGATVDEYARRVETVLTDFAEWSADRGAWEKRVTSKKSRVDGERAPRAPRAETPRPDATGSGNGGQRHRANADGREVLLPIRPDFDMRVTLPPDLLTIAELRKLAYFLLPYTKDWEPTEAPRDVFPTLEQPRPRD